MPGQPQQPGPSTVVLFRHFHVSTHLAHTTVLSPPVGPLHMVCTCRLSAQNATGAQGRGSQESVVREGFLQEVSLPLNLEGQELARGSGMREG